MIIVVMGVAGSGKSTIGSRLATRLDLPFVEADDFHDSSSIARMSAGQALSATDRIPWLDRLHAELVRLAPRGAVCACSALTRASRRRLTADLHDVRLVWLHGPADVIAERLAQRHGHPVGVALLPSQLDTLEPPPRALAVDVRDTPEHIVERIADWVDATGR